MPSGHIRGMVEQKPPKAQRVQTPEYHHRLNGGDPTRGAFVATPGLGFAGFFFPLLKPVFARSGNPTIRQQFFEGSVVAVGNSRNPT